MFFNYLEIGCNSLKTVSKIFTNDLGFKLSPLSSTRHQVCKGDLTIILNEDKTSFNSVKRISFLTPELGGIQHRCKKLSLKTSEVRKTDTGVLYLDIMSPLNRLSHRVYLQDPDQVIRAHHESHDIRLDHVLFCCHRNQAKIYSKWYSELLDLKSYKYEGSHIERGIEVLVNGTGMRMYGAHNPNLPIFAFAEPVIQNSSGFNQIERFLTANKGEGVQHIALKTTNIFNTISDLLLRGIRVVKQPLSYYNLPEKREQFEDLDIDIAAAHENSIIIDRDKDGYLLQVFTESLFDNGGMFIEIIERRGARGFGQGNVKALFSALQDNINNDCNKLLHDNL